MDGSTSISPIENSPSKESKASVSTEDSAIEECFTDALLSQVDEENVNDIVKIQKKTLERFEKTNEMLRNCCILSEQRLEKAKKDFVANKDVILQAKSDLESIFRRIRIFKQILEQKYPEIYAEKCKVHEKEPKEEEE
jgi:hypothetical protein